MENDIKLDADLVHLTLSGGPAFIEFNALDANFIEKMENLFREIARKEKEYQEQVSSIGDNKTLDEDGLPVSLKNSRILYRESCQYMRSRIDNVFGDGVSQNLFGDVMSFPMIAQFIDKIMEYVKAPRESLTAPYMPPETSKRNAHRNHGTKKKKVMK